MSQQLTALLGLEGVEVVSLSERGDEVVLGVELSSRVGECPRCGSMSIELKERAVVRVRDLSIGARRTTLAWRKRRYRCLACRGSFSETHPELPSRQRVSARFRSRLFERVSGGAAHLEVARLEQTTRYQVGARVCAREPGRARRPGPAVGAAAGDR